MTRGPRLDAPGTLHHVIVRGIEKRLIFEDHRDREDFLRRLGTVINEGQAQCFAWALIPNHGHIVLRTGPVPLERMMRRLLTGYAVSFNLRHQRSGHLFQNRYRSIVCEEDAYLLELVRYVHLNPIRAGLVKNMEELDRYAWSGHAVLMGRQKRTWQASQEVLLYFGSRGRTAQMKYRQFVSEGTREGQRADLTGGRIRRRVKKGQWTDGERVDVRVLGSGGFVEEMLAEEERRVRERTILKRRQLDVQGVMDLIAEGYGVKAEEMMGGSRRREISQARSVFCYWVMRELGVPGRRLSEMLRITPPAVHFAAERGEKLSQGDSSLNKSLRSYLIK
jgi:REP element-mobilizing transposase RayT